VRATVSIDGASVTILPRRAPVGASGAIRGRPLAIFASARPPAFAPEPNAPLDAIVEPGGTGFAVLDLSEVEAAALARSLALAEFLYWDGRRAAMLSCAP